MNRLRKTQLVILAIGATACAGILLRFRRGMLAGLTGPAQAPAPTVVGQAPVLAVLHQHTCERCGNRWRHASTSLGVEADHVCTSCGRISRWPDGPRTGQA